MVRQRLPNTRSNRLRNEVYKAVAKKKHTKLKLLLNKSNSHSVLNSWDSAETALDLAASLGDEVSVEILLNNGALPDYKEYHKIMTQSTFYKAIKSRNLKVVELLLMHGCDPNIKLETCPTESQASDRRVVSYWDVAFEQDNVPMFSLLAKYRSLTASNDDKWCRTILNLACEKDGRCHELVKLFLNHGVSIESANRDGHTCLFRAVIGKCIPNILLLISRGANIKHRDSMGRNLLHIAASSYTSACDKMRDLAGVIRLFIDRGCDINATDANGLTPIHVIFAESHGKNNILTWLFLLHPDIDLTIADNRGATVLHYIVAWGTQDVLKHVLCTSNLKILARDKQGNLPMAYLNFSHLDNFGLLLEFGSADTKTLRKLYRKFSRYEFILKIVEQYNYKINAADLPDDFNIQALLVNRNSAFTEEERAEQLAVFTNEVERMKETRLWGTMSFYDFLHVKNKLTCIAIAKKAGMREVFLKSKHGFKYYAILLARNYLNGIRISPIESNAITYAEKNLDVLFNDRLPSLVVYNIMSYIDLADMIILEDMKLRRNVLKRKFILKKGIKRTRKRRKK